MTLPDYTRPRHLPNMAEFDWDTDDEGTEEEEFFLCLQEDHNRSIDRRGHSDTIPAFRMPQGYYGQIRATVEDKQTPYRSISDFMRDAAIHRLIDMVEWSDNEQWCRQAEIIIAAARAESMAVQTNAKRELVEKQINAITTAVNAQHWPMVREAVEFAKELLIFLDIDTRDLAYSVETAERELERHFG